MNNNWEFYFHQVFPLKNSGRFVISNISVLNFSPPEFVFHCAIFFEVCEFDKKNCDQFISVTTIQKCFVKVPTYISS